MKPCRLWVHPEFKKKLKRQAAEEDRSLLDLTEELSRIGTDLTDELARVGQTNEKKKKRHGFDFRI